MKAPPALRDAARPMRREESLQATRKRLLDAAVASLIEQGAARTTTVEVQRRAGVSRGALLHHFPRHAQLLSATVEELVRRNEAAVNRIRIKLKDQADPVERAIRALASMMVQPAHLAELELWAVARTDAELHAALLAAERGAREDSERVVGDLFAPVRDRPGCAAVVAMTAEFLRGMSLSGVLRANSARRRQLVDQWVWAAKILLEQQPSREAKAQVPTSGT